MSMNNAVRSRLCTPAWVLLALIGFPRFSCAAGDSPAPTRPGDHLAEAQALMLTGDHATALLQLAAAMRAVATLSHQERAHLQSESRAHIESHFDLAATVRSYAALYNELISRA